jgi:hypothetical protein
MGETSDRLRDALAAYLDYLEMGGAEPDTSHLSPSERHELDELIGALDVTEGVAFGLGRGTKPPSDTPPARSELGERLHSKLREVLPADVRIEADSHAAAVRVGGSSIAEGWIVGTFGGRIRVWLLSVGSAHEVEANRDCLVDLNKVFGALPDTTAVALVAEDLSCLIVHPEDCAPQINIPSGSLVGRNYRQPVQPVAEALSGLLNELIPYWDPIPALDAGAGLSIDVSAVTQGFVTAAIDEQRGIGQRARKGNPKKDALLALGDKEVAALTKLAKGLFDGSVTAAEVEQRIERLAGDR